MSTRGPIIAIIVATAENGVIGCEGKMPWHLPAELKYFRAQTMGKPVVMGRKTFQSVGKPLPGRDTIVVTRDTTFAPAGVTTASSLEDAIAKARVAAARSGAGEIMVIGGGDIYAQALPLAERVYLTRIALSPEGDAHFPPLQPTQWRLVSEAAIPASRPDEPAATACIYERIAA
jgi:dihydrofolate reductase